MIVAWSLGGVIGPQIVATLSHGKAYTRAFTTIAVIALAALVLPLVTKPPRTRQSETEGYVGEAAATGPGAR
jgi:OFA family oxalate/formate antiporter-like MFS transporter